MTHHDDPQAPETVAFGRGASSTDSVPPIADANHDPGRPTDGVDAWYVEEEPGQSTSEQRSWFASRWQGWQSLDRDRRIIVVLIAVAVIALIAAILGLANRDDSTAIELPAVESHGLNPDEAACFAFGLIENRFEVRLDPAGFETSDPSELSGPINQEIQAIDNLASEHPEADYRLITAFAAVADAGTIIADTDSLTTFRTAVSDRADAVAAASGRCDEVAGFDVADLEPN